jgi:hypothetical protein
MVNESTIPPRAGYTLSLPYSCLQCHISNKQRADE